MKGGSILAKTGLSDRNVRGISHFTVRLYLGSDSRIMSSRSSVKVHLRIDAVYGDALPDLARFRKYSAIAMLQKAQCISYPKKASLMQEYQSLDRTPSKRNLTSFNTLVEGFQSSNCLISSVISPHNSVRTKSSSKSPRMANGSI